jgi:LysM repeat protein
MTSATPSADKLFGVERGEVGYHEGANNQNKYAPVVGVANNQAWCTTFQSWCFLTAGFKSLCLMSDYSVDQLNWFKARGRASQYPAVGAVVWFGPGGENHTGWVYAYDATYIYTIEGNYNNEVNYHKRLRVGVSDSSIGSPYMYGWPQFSEGVVGADPSRSIAGSKYAAVASVTTSVNVPGIVSRPSTTPPPPVVTPPVTTPSAPQTYTVKSGDTLASIASALGVSEADLLAKNPTVLPVGTVLQNPAYVPPPPTVDYTVWPGSGSFVLGQSNGYVTQLTTWLSQRGGTAPVTSTFTTVVQSEMAAFQRAQGWSGSDADGYPGQTSWGMLKNGTGNDIPATPPPGSGWVGDSPINDKTAVLFTRYTGSMTVDQAIAGAVAARGISDPNGYWKKGYETIVARESSGDWNACNRNDLNNVTPSGYSDVHDYGNGYPGGNLNGALTHYQCSRGGAQCIPQTFAAYHCPGTSNMIYDPVANIAASIGYVVAQYGVSHDGHDLASKVQQADPNRPPAGY